jgi:diguanylate cyclase (GGDEF)-like protein/PAS domain S-box-containing protein
MRSRLLTTLVLALLAAFVLQAILQAWPVARQLPPDIAAYLIPLAAIAATLAIFAIAPKRMLGIAPPAPVADAHPEPTPVGNETGTFEQIFNASPVGLLLSRMDTLQVIAVNDALLQLLGLERHEVVDGSEKNLKLLPDTHADTPLTPVPTRLAHADGSVRDALIAVHILRLGNTRYRLTAVTDAKTLYKTFNALSESEARYRQMFDDNLGVKLIVDPNDGRIVNANKAAARFYGHPAETLRGLNIGELNMAPPSTIRARLQEAANSEGVLFETQHRLASGETRDVEVYTGPIMLDGHKLLYSIVHDVSLRHQAQGALQREQALAKATLDAIGDAVIRCDSAGRVEFMNRNAEELTGRSLDDARGQPLADTLRLSDEDSDKELVPAVPRQDEVQPHKLIARIRTTNRELITQVTTARVDREAGFVVVLHDITSLRQLSRKLSFQAAHDPLTGLINRREFERQLAAHIAQAHDEEDSHVLCYIDLDQFKVVNDTSGHRAGDALLAQVGELLMHGVRRSDIVARLGGDEFGLLLTHCDVTMAEDIAAKLIRDIGQMPFMWESKQFHIGASIGMVLINDGTHSLEEAMSTADSACYLAKERGRNRYVIHVNQEDTVIQRQREMEWLRHLHGAMSTDGFQLHYQRIQPLAAQPKRPQQFEFLLRMNDPHGGDPIRPDSFIPAAERFGMMPAIDRWVIEQTCTLLKRLGPEAPILVYVNLSGHSLAHPEMVDFTTRALRESGINARQIGFEITETAAIGNLSQAHRFIDALSALGCPFALDDFGSGLSSFAYLKNLRVQKLKIDGGFVRDTLQDPVSYAMVEAINRIGHTLGLETVAEWTDSQELIEEMRSIGVDYVQGYAVDGGPQPVDTLEETLFNGGLSGAEPQGSQSERG